jgi:hypothetical protein
MGQRLCVPRTVNADSRDDERGITLRSIVRFNDGQRTGHLPPCRIQGTFPSTYLPMMLRVGQETVGSLRVLLTAVHSRSNSAGVSIVLKWQHQRYLGPVPGVDAVANPSVPKGFHGGIQEPNRPDVVLTEELMAVLPDGQIILGPRVFMEGFLMTIGAKVMRVRREGHSGVKGRAVNNQSKATSVDTKDLLSIKGP